MNIQEQRIRSEQAMLAFEDRVIRQEAIAAFILSHMQMAHDLRQMCEVRRLASHPVDMLEEPAAMLEAKLCEGFEKTFGHTLVPSMDTSNA